MTRRDMWGGRFGSPTSEMMKQLNDSLSFDAALLNEEIDASIAWAQALANAGVLSSSEKECITNALQELRGSTPEGAEDVHSYVEAHLTEKFGVLGKKLHTGRSRNDQVATDLRLYLMKAFTAAKEQTLDLAGALAKRASEEAATPMPGYTHLKQAEPITFGHWCLAYAEMLQRDAGRFSDAAERADECPLGSGALAGTPIEIDRHQLAKTLGFARPTANSLDAVSDRDAAAEYLFAATLLFVHLSRLAEDLIIFSSDEFSYVELPDELATGSSRMPQKKNPDALELTRGHAGRAIGELTGLLALLKGLPLAYNKDLQLDKEPLFRMRATIAAVLPVLTSLIEKLRLNRDRMRQAASSDLLLATSLADALTRRGVPFREAHETVGKALSGEGNLEELGISSLSLDTALDAKSSFGGTAPARVREAAAAVSSRAGERRARR